MLLCLMQSGLPVTRLSVYIVGSLELSFAELTSVVDAVSGMESQSATDCMPMDAFLLDESSPLIAREYEDRLAGKSAHASKHSNPAPGDFQWVIKNTQPFAADRPTRSDAWMSPDAANKWVDLLTDR